MVRKFLTLALVLTSAAGGIILARAAIDTALAAPRIATEAKERAKW